MGIEQFEVSAGWVLARLARQLEVALHPLGLSVPQYRLLSYLAMGEASSSRLASNMTVSPPSITAVVDGLVARDLVERRPDPADRRRQALMLTSTGKKLVIQANDAVATRLEEVLGHLDARRAGAARASLSHWQVGLDRHREAKQRRVQTT